jgi:hypothetical protein
MDFRSIVTYPSVKDMNARESYADMNDSLGADCIGYSTVTKHLRENSFLKSILDTDFEPKIEGENVIDEPIFGVLEEFPFSSFRQIAKRIFIPMTTVRYHSVNSLGIESGTFAGFPTHSYRAKNKHSSR